ncbi:MAG: hypothetical protein IPG75_15020 [Gemmatimonadetes bacterium]|nr:hypothetical protein [Gemmatimonadota bacterium]
MRVPDPGGARVVALRFADTTDALLRLRALAWRGRSGATGWWRPITRDRLEHELTIIAQKGFADYFLVVHDIVQHGPTHCGRGSVANSIVSYCLGITHVDPLGAGLLFERFSTRSGRTRPTSTSTSRGRARPDPGRVFRRYPRPQGHGGQPQLLPAARRRCARWPGVRLSAGRDPRGHPPLPRVQRGRVHRPAARHPSQLPGAQPPGGVAGAGAGGGAAGEHAAAPSRCTRRW